MRLAKITLIAALIAPSCRSVELTRSDFLSDYSQLERDTNERARESHVSPGMTSTSYDGVFLEPLAIQLQASSLDKCSAKHTALLQEHYTAYLEASVPPGLPILEAASPNSLIVRSALTELDTCNMAVNWITGLFVLWPVDVGGATLEVEELESASGNQVAAIVNADKGTLWNGIGAMTRVGHACQALEETAQWVGEVLPRPSTQ